MTTRRRYTPRAEDLAGLAVRAAGSVALATLVVFHAWLLWIDLARGTALEPETAIRWVVGFLVLAGFRRLGAPLLFSRRAMVLWLLVILIHAHAVGVGGSAAIDLGIPETAGLLSQIAALAAALAVLHHACLAATPNHRLRPRSGWPRPARVAGLPWAVGFLRFSPRPPPLA